MPLDPLERVRRLREARLREDLGKGTDASRVPPGQWVTERWPVLHYGNVPRVDLRRWDFRVWGLVEDPLRWTYEEFMALPKVTVRADVHCVTHWSLLDSVWEGVAFREVMTHVRLKPGAQFVLIHAENGFTSNLPLDVLMDDDVLFAYRRNGEELTPEHGWPLRLVVPKRYFWKSAKWVRGLEFLDRDVLGFWERAGYHNNADPWREERFAE